MGQYGAARPPASLFGVVGLHMPRGFAHMHEKLHFNLHLSASLLIGLHYYVYFMSEA